MYTEGCKGAEMNKVKCKYLSVLASVGLAVLLLFVQTNAALAATAPSLGVAESFGVLGHEAVTNTGSSIIYGDLGLYPGTSITGFFGTTANEGPGLVIGGTVHQTDAVAQLAQDNASTAYTNLASQPYDVDMSGLNLGGRTLGPGVYFYSSSAQLTGTLTLDALGDANSVFIFQIGTSLTTDTDAKVVVINPPTDPNWCNKFWQVGSAATLGTRTEFVGTIIAGSEAINMVTGAKLYGRAISLNAAVTLDTNTITVPVCTTTPTTPFPTPTLSGWGLILLTGLLVSVGFFTLRKSGKLRLG
jgi:type VI secretion system secreted protein VgrG